jgi:hypothetical protein
VLEDQKKPKVCPVCGSDSVTQILCDTLLSAEFRGMACPSEGVLAYHCEGNHVFLILRRDFRWGEPVSTAPVVQSAVSKRPSAASVIRERVVDQLLAPSPSFWVMFGTMLGRNGSKLQSLGLL